MAQMGRPGGLSAAQKAELWQRWGKGQSVSEIGKALGKNPGSIHGMLSGKGGIQPTQRHRSLRVLNLEEREAISRGIAVGSSIRQISREVGRSPSTISREINRNDGRIIYRATKADERAWTKARRPKASKLESTPQLRLIVARKLEHEWSPEQIAGWLKQKYPDDPCMQVSHETIYRSLFIQARGVLKQELVKHLRSHRVMRHAKGASAKGQPRGQIKDAISIRERPAEIEDRAVPGHWEGDLITGSKNSHIATLVERKSRFTMLVKVAGKDTESVVHALTKQIGKLPTQLRRSLTWDRGMELARHKELSIATDVQVYFCDPSSPWQRGTNENTNRLLRQYFPYGMDLSAFSQAELNKVALRLNQRPRKTLGYKTPADTFLSDVALTG
jgi:IS30 family transposase